jgi:dipeptidyl aminopeptidase/acylaminoacyl peptidase
MSQSMKKKELPYGLWPSPISAQMVSHGFRLGDVQWDSSSESLVWLEGRGDRGVLVARRGEDAPRDLTVDENVRAWVGYGGGDFTVARGLVFFADINGRLYRRGLDEGIAYPITPPHGRAASPELSPDGEWLLYVYSDGKDDLLAMVRADGSQWPQQVTRGADFYMQPTWHPNGKQIAWVEWNHPNMPWDATRIKMGKLEGNPPRLADVHTMAEEPDIPAVQPQFSSDGKWLSYIVGHGEWEDLVLLNLQSGEKRVLVKGDGFHLAFPAWAQGMRSYGWSRDSRHIYTIRNFAAQSSLWEVDLESGKSTQIDTQPYTFIHQISVSTVNNQVAFLATSPSIPERVVRWDVKALHVAGRSSAEMIPEGYLAAYQPVTWQAPDGMTVYAHYYPPTHPDYQGSGLPPALLSVHGGPTGSTPIAYSGLRTYFTSRGYAFLELDYRGSTSYGRSYQRVMRGRWGDVDTQDTDGAAQALIDQKLADGSRLAIIGGSAGGYLVLNALVHYPGRFKAGIDLYGVSNLFNLARDTHKFELRYLDSMVGPLPDDAEKYRAFSAIFHADRIRDPMAIFQGSVDPVVPPNQSEEIVAALQRNNVPHIYRKYEGEGHGFRKPESNIDFLEQTERFLQQYVLFA